MLGKIVSNEAELDLDLAYTLLDMGKELPFDVVTGKTVATNDFYEGKILHKVNKQISMENMQKTLKINLRYGLNQASFHNRSGKIRWSILRIHT